MQYLSLIYRRMKDVVMERLNTLFFGRSDKCNVDTFHLFHRLKNNILCSIRVHLYLTKIIIIRMLQKVDAS